MSKRRQIVLPDPVDEQLCQLAAGADTPPSTLAAQLVQTSLARATRNGAIPAQRALPAPRPAAPVVNERPPWLEPYGGDPDWRRQMWGQIVALHSRYPDQLQALKDKWWNDDSTTETLCALATWRAELDDTAKDPRDELAFQAQLDDYAQQLRQQSRGVTKTWKPGPTPPEWDAGP